MFVVSCVSLCWTSTNTSTCTLRGRANANCEPQTPTSALSASNLTPVVQGMTLVPSVTELILAELLYLQYEDPEKPIYLYINSTGTSKVLALKGLGLASRI